MGTFFRARRPIKPLVFWAMTTALAYAVGRRLRSGEPARAGILRRSGRATGSGRSRG
jgi:hypothetical protein